MSVTTALSIENGSLVLDGVRRERGAHDLAGRENTVSNSSASSDEDDEPTRLARQGRSRLGADLVGG